MPQITATDIRILLDSRAEESVLYLKADDDQDPEIDVWAGAYVSHRSIITTQHEAREFLGDDPDEELMTTYLAELQETVDERMADRT